MGNGSVKSDFRFLSFKIDEIKLSILHDIGVVQFDCNYEKCEWNQGISIRNPVYFESSKVYLCGLDSAIKLIHHKEGNEKKATWLKLNMGIVGLFAIEERIPEELEKRFVTINAPAILFPFLRAAGSNILASSGFGSVIMPLINMYKVGAEYAAKKDFSVTVK
ncbi:MAG: protein-export chaperone SecB [Syntrophales bacterium]